MLNKRGVDVSIVGGASIDSTIIDLLLHPLTNYDYDYRTDYSIEYGVQGTEYRI